MNDRIIIRGSLPGVSYAGGMTCYLYSNRIMIFDYKKFASGLRDDYNDYVMNFSETNKVSIIPVNSYKISKEDKVKEIIEKRGNHPGLICIISAVEGCSIFYSWRNKETRKSYLRHRPGRCKHNYFYFIDEYLGLCYLRIATYAPFGVQFYCNGHNILAGKLNRAGIKYHMLDNCFDYIEDYEKAQSLGNNIDTSLLKGLLDYYAGIYCPVHKTFSSHLNWSIMQLEYSTDIIFSNLKDLAAIYGDITRTAIHTVKVDRIATFLGKRFTAAFNEPE